MTKLEEIKEIIETENARNKRALNESKKDD